MSQRAWYKKKRYWLLLVLLSIFILSRMEWAKMRYDKDTYLSTLNATVPHKFHYDTRSLGNKEIHYISNNGRPELPILLMVHGSPGALNAYDEYLKDPLLYDNFNLISVDRSGFGYSNFGIAESSLNTQSGLIAKILEQFPNQKKILAGHSMGGPILSNLAIEHPELVDGLVLIAPSISPDLEPSNAWRKFINFPLLRWFTPPALRVCNQEIIPLKVELEQMKNSWAEIDIPVTIVQGELDRLVPKGNALYAKASMPDNSAVKINMVNGGNHFILWSEIPLIRNEILAMLELL